MENICELINVSKSYGNNNVLENINISIYQGEMVAIIGKSGSGKSTILNIIGMLEKPDCGDLRIFNEKAPLPGSIKSNKLLREKLAYLFQNYALIDNSTINYNLEIPLTYSKKTKKEKKRLKIQALEKVGINLSINQKIHKLSGGEQQKIAIARILLKSYDLILADEPTGSLDSNNRDEIIKILKDIHNSGKTIIIVTHDSSVANACDRIIDLDKKFKQ